MAKDVNNTQVVTEEDVTGQVVTDQGVSEQVAVAQNQDELADGTDSNKPVPHSRFNEAIKAKNEAEESRKAAEDQAAHAQRQLELMQQQQLAQANPPQAPKSSMEQAMADCNVTAEEMFGEVTVRVIARKDQIDAANAQQQQGLASVRQFAVNHPDLIEVVGSVNPNGQIVAPNAKVLALLAKKPYLAGATLEAIYDSVKQDDKLAEFEKAAAVNKEHQNRLDNETQPLGGSAAGGSGGSGDIQQKMMSREEVLEQERKFRDGEM